MGGPLEPVVHARAMRRRGRASSKPSPGEDSASAPTEVSASALETPPVSVTTETKPAPAAAKPPRVPSKRRSRFVSGLEGRIGYRFNDLKLIDCALTHISAMT